MLADWTNISGGNASGKCQKTKVARGLNTEAETVICILVSLLIVLLVWKAGDAEHMHVC